MIDILKTGISNSRNVCRYMFGKGVIENLDNLLAERRSDKNNLVIFFIDQYFRDKNTIDNLNVIGDDDFVFYVNTLEEPTTIYINQIYKELKCADINTPCAIVGIGGGITMDTAKAISNLLTNGGKAEDYQGWDLVKKPSVYKIGAPSISGTGAEATRTCVMINPENGLKLGMNSDYTVFDQLLLDPDLSVTVPRNQYFYTGMDAYIHCIESLSGNYRNAVGDAFSEETLKLCLEIFHSEDMMSDVNREKLMVASYLGGCAIANSYVGIIHPFSAGLSVVLGLHHCVANCISMRAMEEFYPREYQEFFEMAVKQNVDIPKNVCHNLTSEQYDHLYQATIIHEKPLTNALGTDYRNVLTHEKVIEIFKKM